MSGELEAAGAMATAGLVAGAIEGRQAHDHAEGACLNCGAVLAGAYCSQCGQAAHAHRTLSHLFEEVLHGLFHFDTKAWRTLPMLASRPGTLTHDYIYGKRARYISPLALFLFTVFFMFFVFAFVDVDLLQVNAGPGGPISEQRRAELQADLQEARADLQRTEQELAARRAAAGGAVTEDERGVVVARRVVERLEARLAEPTPAATPQATTEASPEADAAGAHAVAGEPRWQDAVSEAAKNGDITVGTPFPQLNQRIQHSLENPDLALYKMQQAAYKFSFLLVPISLPFIWLLFLWKRGLTLYDHAVFTLYSLSFASLIFVFAAVTEGVPWLQWLGAMAMLAMPVHMFFHLKGAYALGWYSAFWRTLFLLLFAFLSLTIFMIAIIVLGLGG
ncbi:MAG: DUF3667 domain-containing protein [Hyphomonadaceae bacterium]|nr:DUF3667 domain-containing protein [Hyphomonadaceae bacterium]